MIDSRTEAARVVHALLEHLVGPQQERLRNRQSLVLRLSRVG